ncbi:MAG: hypothetical protein ABIJ96_09530 [Elusimicrobiota bacterium]
MLMQRTRTGLLAGALCANLLSPSPGGCQEPYARLVREVDAEKAAAALIEVGGPYMGVVMYNGSPLPTRLSFYYPVANSVDMRPDYWAHDASRALALGLKIGDGPKEWIGGEPYAHRLTPYSVVFHKRDDRKAIEISYRFFENKPGMAAAIELTNTGGAPETFELFTQLEAAVKTSHSFTLKDKAWTESRDGGATLIVHFDDSEAGDARLFAANAGEAPAAFATDGGKLGAPGTDESWWIKREAGLPRADLPKSAPGRPAAAFVYRKRLAPGEKMTVVQLIGAARAGEVGEMVGYLRKNYRREAEVFERRVLEKSAGGAETGDAAVDHSVRWARAMLAANAHYLDGEIVPMPCPAEYNFHFTHDALMTDMGAVSFDPARAKRDLLFIVSRAKEDHVIPHAYYWKDGRYATEFASPTNWNHFWFVLVSARYLRHSGDLETLRKLYPYLETSVRQMLVNMKDDVIGAERPDWWDIGRSFGPRAYMTILAARSLREFSYVCSALEQGVEELSRYAELAGRLERGLGEKLWDGELGYLINYNLGGKKDPHLYTGSLLAAHFGLLDREKTETLARTASATMVDPDIGVYNAVPMDFHTLKDFFKFEEGEAGEPYYYMNGGVWSHGNAWYALALRAAGRRDEAFRFLKKIMTVDGAAASPRGHAAMYEFRIAKKGAPAEYGLIHKPQFLWAGGWFLYAVHDLLGLRENAWNFSFEPRPAEGREKARFELAVGGKSIDVEIRGGGPLLAEILFDGKPYPSAVMPETQAPARTIELVLGVPRTPYLAAAGSRLLESVYDPKDRTLRVRLQAFAGHRGRAVVISPARPKEVRLDGRALTEGWSVVETGGAYRLEADYLHGAPPAELAIRF